MSTDHLRFKKLHFFVLASAALIGTGFIFSERPYDWLLLVYLLYCNLNGIFLVYRLNDCIDQDKDLSLNLKAFFNVPLHKWVSIQFFLVLIPLAFYFLNAFTFSVLGIAAIIGFVYSLSFKTASGQFRVKNMFFVKNLLIGLAWGSLVLIGAGNIASNEVLTLFVLASIQVLIGSMIRDVPDREKDSASGVRSFPVVIGNARTIFFMMTLNFGSFAAAYLVNWDLKWMYSIGIVVVWRFINLIMLKNQEDKPLWSQSFNLLCCLVIFLVTLGLFWYGNN